MKKSIEITHNRNKNSFQKLMKKRKKDVGIIVLSSLRQRIKSRGKKIVGIHGELG